MPEFHIGQIVQHNGKSRRRALVGARAEVVGINGEYLIVKWDKNDERIYGGAGLAQQDGSYLSYSFDPAPKEDDNTLEEILAAQELYAKLVACG